MATYKELLERRQALDNEIDQARQHELSDAIARARALVEEYGLTQTDVFGAGRKGRSSQAGRKVAPKYRNPLTNDTWTGRGRQPKWIQGKNLNDFLIK
ncbi:MAG: H-NS histone family protein [Burkholderiales bacterium]